MAYIPVPFDEQVKDLMNKDVEEIKTNLNMVYDYVEKHNVKDIREFLKIASITYELYRKGVIKFKQPTTSK